MEFKILALVFNFVLICWPKTNLISSDLYISKLPLLHVVPMTWIPVGVTHSFTYESGARDVWVDYGNLNTPFVKGLNRCGQPAEYMKLTPEFIMNNSIGNEVNLFFYNFQYGLDLKLSCL